MTRRPLAARRLLGAGAALTLAAGIGVAAVRTPAHGSAATVSMPGSLSAPAAGADSTSLQPAGYTAQPAAAQPAAAQPAAAQAPAARSAPQQAGDQRAGDQQAGSATAPRAQSAPRLHPQAPPSYATQAPMGSNVILPRGSSLRVYAHATGRVRLIDLSNPLLRGVPLVLAQEGRATSHRIPVALPVRPNNVVGWVNRSDVRVRPDHWRIAIYRSQHRLLVWRDQTLMGSFPVAVGKPSTPTPSGIFYLLVKMTSWGDYGPWLMPTSGFSDVYQTFGLNGGDAAIAIHGTNEDSSVGHSISHGCIRMHNRDVSLIAPVLSVGTLVQIH